MTVRHVRDCDGDEQTTWPVDVMTDDEDATAWRLRYASPGIITREDRLSAASVMSAYAYLVDPALTQAQAIESLKRARRCARAAFSANHLSPPAVQVHPTEKETR